MKQKGFSVILILVGIFIAATVIISGAYYLGTLKTKSSVQNPVITSQTPQITPSSNPDETSNWKTYINTNLGFLVKYPSSLEVSEREDRVYLSKDDEVFTFVVIDRGNIGSIQEVIRGLYEDNGTANTRTPKYTTKTIMLDGVSATEYFGCAGVEGCQDTYFVLAEKNHKLYQISYNIPYSKPNIYKQVLSTFKFTDQKQSAASCINDQSDILVLINNFENLQMKKDTFRVLALFTPPTKSEDIDTYNFFTGKKTGSIGLYGNVTTNFNERDYKVIGSPTENSNGCTISVEEQRSVYFNADPVGYQPPGTYKAKFDVIKQGNNWKIDRYYPNGPLTGQPTNKYSAWGY